MADCRLSLRIGMVAMAGGAVVGALVVFMIQAPTTPAMRSIGATVPVRASVFAAESMAAIVVAGALETAWSVPGSSEEPPPAAPSEAPQQQVRIPDAPIEKETRPVAAAASEPPQEQVSIPETAIEALPAETAPAEHSQTTGGIKAEQLPKASNKLDKNVLQQGQLRDRAATTGPRTNVRIGRSLPRNGEWGW